MWDVRARKALYELSTGNSSVSGLAWDPARNQLFAATECTYRDSYGNHFDYRPASFRDSDLDDSDGYDDYDSDDDDERAWPEHAAHEESSFGHPFDAGDHLLRESRVFDSTSCSSAFI